MSGASAECLALAAQTARRREPPHRRTHQPVRRNSRMTGDWERGFLKPMSWAEAAELHRAGVLFDRAHKQKGDRHGPLGSIGLELLQELCALAVNCRGKVWPTLAWLQAKLKRSRDTIVRALAALKAAGLVDWARRIAPAEDDGAAARGQRVRQISNLYRLAVPEALRKFIRRRPKAADDAARKAQMLAGINAMIREENADALDGRIAAAVARGAAAKDRDLKRGLGESDRPSQSGQKEI